MLNRFIKHLGDFPHNIEWLDHTLSRFVPQLADSGILKAQTRILSLSAIATCPIRLTHVFSCELEIVSRRLMDFSVCLLRLENLFYTGSQFSPYCFNKQTVESLVFCDNNPLT